MLASRLLLPVLVFTLAFPAWAAESFNTPGKPQCPTLLGGKPGVALTVEKARELRDKVAVDLPGCLKAQGLLKEQSEALEKALAASKDQNRLLQDALTFRRQEGEELRKALQAAPKPNRALWLGIGLALGVAATIGIVYALRPAGVGQVTQTMRTGLGVRF